MADPKDVNNPSEVTAEPEPTPEPEPVDIVLNDEDIVDDVEESGGENPLPTPPPAGVSTPITPVATRRTNGFICGFPQWLKWFIPAAALVLAGLIIWSALKDRTATIDPHAITEAVDNSEVAARVDGLEQMLIGDGDNPGLNERLGENGVGGQIYQVSATVNQLVTVVNNLNVTVGNQSTQIADLKKSVDNGNEKLDKLANQLLADGNALCWSSPQFGWAQTVLSASSRADFVQDTLPKIKDAADTNPNMIVRVVGRVDRSSTKSANDGQVKTGNGRATYIAKILRDNGVKVAKTTWAYSYSPNRRVVDVYVEPPK